ncbi:unnamed protein product [Mytilus coruscus]|uniref:Endonuclease/exonuclease/phosphatase domain-containing protein n=1 Tax=Mytilus coruscus TaxID=42192 RepID=A0A6J8C7C6_MYTCO|nr:unnamed protein product [Mytilus coruscus]
MKFIDCSILSIVKWNKSRNHQNPAKYKSEDFQVTRQVKLLNSKKSELNRSIGKNTIKLSQYFFRGRKVKRGGVRKPVRIAINKKDGIHPSDSIGNIKTLLSSSQNSADYSKTAYLYINCKVQQNIVQKETDRDIKIDKLLEITKNHCESVLEYSNTEKNTGVRKNNYKADQTDPHRIIIIDNIEKSSIARDSTSIRKELAKIQDFSDNVEEAYSLPKWGVAVHLKGKRQDHTELAKAQNTIWRPFCCTQTQSVADGIDIAYLHSIPTYMTEESILQELKHLYEIVAVNKKDTEIQVNQCQCQRMKILLLNAQAISTAYQQLVNIVNNYDVDIVCLNETHQNENKFFLDWQVHDVPRVGRKEGGVAICINTHKSNFIATRTSVLDDKDYKSVGINIQTDSNHCFNIVTPYIPPEEIEQMEKLSKNIENYT